MKKIVCVALIFVLGFMFVSCDELLAGIGNERGSENITEEETPYIELPVETWPAIETELNICVDWSDFVRIEGIIYDGGFKNETIDESLIGERVGEILHNVKSMYSSEQEMRDEEYRNYTASFRSIGCEIFEVKGDGNSIAVLDSGQYYLYTRNAEYPRNFEVYGGEMYLPYMSDETCLVINSYSELCEALGGAENIPQEVRDRYDGDALYDKTLIIVKLISGWGGTEYGIASVTGSGDNITVNAVQFDTSVDGTDDMHYWTFFVEISKTDINNAIITLELIEPLKTDSELEEVSDKMGGHIPDVIDVDLKVYDSAAVISKEAAEEFARDLFGQQMANATVFYNPVRNYWLVKLSRYEEYSSFEGAVVIRAADGKIISQTMAIGCS